MTGDDRARRIADARRRLAAYPEPGGATIEQLRALTDEIDELNERLRQARPA